MEGVVGVGVGVTTTTTGVGVGVAVTTTTLSVGTVTGASVDAGDGACAEVQATPNAAIPKSTSTPMPIFDTIAEIKLRTSWSSYCRCWLHILGSPNASDFT